MEKLIQSMKIVLVPAMYVGCSRYDHISIEVIIVLVPAMYVGCSDFLHFSVPDKGPF